MNIQYQRQSVIVIMSAFACGLFSLLYLRLGHIQLLQGATFQKQADQNRFFEQVLPAGRGLITDRYGEPLVWNIQQYFQVSDPTILFPVTTPISRQEAIRLIASQGASAVITRPERLYRYPESLAHILGYVGEVTAEDLQNNSNLKPGMVIGKSGLELVNQDKLRGQEGKIVYEVDALGKKQRQVQIKLATAGQDVSTTLDPYLSELIYRRLGNVQGAVIMTDLSTGKVIGLVSRPSFDPNAFSKEDIQQLFADPRNVFFNRAVSGTYPPGSIFKLMTALAGLEHNKVDEHTQVVDQGVLKVGEYEFGNWYFRQYGRVEGAIGLRRAISRSNDIFFYKVAEWVGPDGLAEFARTFGFGSKTGIELPAEARGLIPDHLWKEKVKGEQWFLGDTYHFGIGQGDVLTSPLQIAQMTQAIGNNGMLCPLSVLRSSSLECRQLGLVAEHLEMVRGGMMDACSSGGTAFPFFSYNQTRTDPTQSSEVSLSQGAVACKTGTAEFGAADAQGHRRTHGWFTMFVSLPERVTSKNGETHLQTTLQVPSGPLEQVDDQQLHQFWQERVHQFGFPSRIGITVLVESDDTVPYREGSRDAAPIARQVIDWMDSGNEGA